MNPSASPRVKKVTERCLRSHLCGVTKLPVRLGAQWRTASSLLMLPSWLLRWLWDKDSSTFAAFSSELLFLNKWTLCYWVIRTSEGLKFFEQNIASFSLLKKRENVLMCWKWRAYKWLKDKKPGQKLRDIWQLSHHHHPW